MENDELIDNVIDEYDRTHWNEDCQAYSKKSVVEIMRDLAKRKDEQFKEMLQALPKSVKDLIVELSDIEL